MAVKRRSFKNIISMLNHQANIFGDISPAPQLELQQSKDIEKCGIFSMSAVSRIIYEAMEAAGAREQYVQNEIKRISEHIPRPQQPFEKNLSAVFSESHKTDRTDARVCKIRQQCESNPHGVIAFLLDAFRLLVVLPYRYC